jgi:hypothetical protein
VYDEVMSEIEKKFTPLTGHVSPETALVIDDYPYGFHLRCKIRYWLEYRPSHGFRFMSQTTNPKKSGEVWNKPKGSTYAALGVMVRNETPGDEFGHITWMGIGMYNAENLDAFGEKYGAAFDSNQLLVFKAMKAAWAHHLAKKARQS